MYEFSSALSGELLVSFSGDEVVEKCVKPLKNYVAKLIGAARFRQRWFSDDDSSELQDNMPLLPPLNIRLLILDFVHEDSENQNQKLFSARAGNQM